MELILQKNSLTLLRVIMYNFFMRMFSMGGNISSILIPHTASIYIPN